MTDILKSTGEGPSVVLMLFFLLYHLIVASSTTKGAEKTVLLSLRSSSSLCLHAAVMYCLFVSLSWLQFIFMLINLSGTSFKLLNLVIPGRSAVYMALLSLLLEMSHQLVVRRWISMTSCSPALSALRRTGCPEVVYSLQIHKYSLTSKLVNFILQLKSPWFFFFVLGIVNEIPMHNLTDHCYVSVWKISMYLRSVLCLAFSLAWPVLCH